MKKFYLVTMVGVTLYTTSNAQCPGPNPAFATPVISSNCRVLVQNMNPNSPLIVLNAIGENITLGTPTTNATGSGSAFYNCNSSPSLVGSLGPNGTCLANIAPAIILPIKLEDYSVVLQSNNVAKLQWRSSFESNSYKYVVLKSTDGRNFTTIGNVEAAVNSSKAISYSFEDKQVLDGAAFYRLQMVDLDGSFTYSKVVYVNNKRGTSRVLSVFPNPFRSEVQLVGAVSGDVNRGSIRVFNAMGKEISYTISGANAITIDANAAPGMYILKIREQAYKLIKQ